LPAATGRPLGSSATQERIGHEYLDGDDVNERTIGDSISKISGWLPLLQRALAILEIALGPEHPDVALFLTHRARLFAAKGDLTQAIAFQSRAGDISERNLALNVATGSERQKLS